MQFHPIGRNRKLIIPFHPYLSIENSLGFIIQILIFTILTSEEKYRIFYQSE